METEGNGVELVRQGDLSTMAGNHNFHVVIPKGALAATPITQGELSYFEWYIVTDPMEIDGDKEYSHENLPTPGSSSDTIQDSMENRDEEGDRPDKIDNIEEDGRSVEEEEPHQHLLSINPLHLNTLLPQPAGPLKGYEYTEFNPTPINPNLPGVNSYMRMSQGDALAALEDLKKILNPSRDTGRGYKDPEIDLWRRARLEGMNSMLNMFTNQQSHTYNQWGASACQGAISMGWGRHCARRLCQLNRAFVADRKVLPVNPYGDWNESLLVNDNLVNEISIYLLSLGNEITALKLQDFLHRHDIKEKYGIERDISHKTACRYLQALGYRYQLAPKGQYTDGHEREDVVTYRNKVFIPKWQEFMYQMATWDKDLKEHLPSEEGRRVIAWFHDESVFYAHDCRKKGWYHKDASAKPYAKGEGTSLMVADFVSADFGWLTSPDGSRSARRLFRPGANRDGYFTNEQIIEQVDEAIDILQEYYPTLTMSSSTTTQQHI